MEEEEVADGGCTMPPQKQAGSIGRKGDGKFCHIAGCVPNIQLVPMMTFAVLHSEAIIAEYAMWEEQLVSRDTFSAEKILCIPSAEVQTHRKTYGCK